MNLDTQVIVTSTVKNIVKAEDTGTLFMYPIELYRLYSYYIGFTQEAIDNGFIDFIDKNRELKEKLAFIKYKYSNYICNYKNIITTNTLTPITVENTAPIVLDNNIDLGINTTYQFSVKDFINGYFDADGDAYNTVLIKPLFTGLYKIVNSTKVFINLNEIIEFSIKGLSPENKVNLYFDRPETVFSNVITYRVSDVNINKKYSLFKNITIFNNTDISTNLPATIGDIAIIRENRVTTIITLEMLTSQLTPPYNDPENDSLDAIRIEEVSTANQGKFYLNSVEINEGQIISVTDITNNLLTHVGANVDTISSDVFRFSVRDTGSMKFVE